MKWDRTEGHVLHFISQMPRDGVVLDIGANIGISVLEGGAVVPFDPERRKSTTSS